jgi:hypothetical protein
MYTRAEIEPTIFSSGDGRDGHAARAKKSFYFSDSTIYSLTTQGHSLVYIQQEISTTKAAAIEVLGLK